MRLCENLHNLNAVYRRAVAESPGHAKRFLHGRSIRRTLSAVKPAERMGETADRPPANRGRYKGGPARCVLGVCHQNGENPPREAAYRTEFEKAAIAETAAYRTAVSIDCFSLARNTVSGPHNLDDRPFGGDFDNLQPLGRDGKLRAAESTLLALPTSPTAGRSFS